MSELFADPVKFWKMQGCGNDFVVVDNRELKLPQEKMSEWAVAVCRRCFGVYADGLFFWDEAPEGSGLDYVWHFYNSDGSRAEMCGNASRCSGRLAYGLGLADIKHVLGTDAGPIHIEVLPENDEVKVQLTPPRGLDLNFELKVGETRYNAHFADTGVPHVVIFVDDIEAVDIKPLGRAVRLHDHFAPAGTNVNFAQVVDKETVLVRTYERGVEDETYACGTGVAAVQYVASKLGKTDPVAALTTTGKETLTVHVEGDTLFLQGGAECTFAGELYPVAMGL